MIGILDYGAGNLTSVRLAFERLGADAIVAAAAEDARDCDKIVFPGVGSAGSGMEGFTSRGFDKLLKLKVKQGCPILAICLGMQMLFERSAEDDGVEGLGIFKGEVIPFQFPGENRVKIPHMGWNGVSFPRQHPLFEGIRNGEAFYFVHSYFASPACQQDVAGQTEYAGFQFTSAVAKGSVLATQFHPERSGAAGLKLLRNFIQWEG